MSERLRDVHSLLQHDHAKRNPGYPANEANYGKDTEKGEYHCRRIVMSYKVVNSRSNTKRDMENTGDPNELLGEGPRKSEVAPGYSECDDQDENEENDRVCIE